MRENDKRIENKQAEETINTVSDSLLSNFLIDWENYKVIWRSNSKIEGEKLWVNVKNPVPIYYLEWAWIRKGWYNINEDYILMFSNADDETLKHEIIHSIEYKQKPTKELEEFYEMVKVDITEDSFEGWAVSFNFQKNIHEFIADGYSKGIFINALKKENLYAEFLDKTEYLFE